MKMTREKTEDGMFFGIHISNEEMAQKFDAITTLSVTGIAEEPIMTPSIPNILLALMSMASEIEEEEKRDKEWQELLALEEQEISEAGRSNAMAEQHKKNYGGNHG